MVAPKHVLDSNDMLAGLDLVEISKRLQSGAITSVELVNGLKQQIARLNPTLNAFVSFNEEALEEAQASDARRAQGRSLGLLDGVPVAIKDNLHVRGLVTSWGNSALAETAPQVRDELPVERLREAGMVVLGKTNVPEFTLEGYTGNPVYGVTRNPWDTALTPGGSSGGSVAAVASGMAPCSLATDGGGSIRRPASHTGLVGLKPSAGRVPRANGLPRIMLDLEVAGPITRTVADAALMYELLAGPDPRDQGSLQVPDRVEESLQSQRILYVQHIGGNPLDLEIARAGERFCASFKGLGHEISVGELPFSMDFFNRFWPLMGSVAVASLFHQLPEARFSAAEKWQSMADAGKSVEAFRYLEAIDQLQQFRREVDTVFERFDVIIMPSAAALPWPAEQVYPVRIDDHEVGPRGHAVYTGWVNASGCPALNLPAGFSESGLPIGFQIIGRYGCDRLLLALGLEYEQRVGCEGYATPTLLRTAPKIESRTEC